MHIKRFDRSCIKICIRRHAFHQTEWTDVANWVKVCPSGCRFRLFFANAHRLRLTRPELANSSLLRKTREKEPQHRRDDGWVEGKQREVLIEASSQNSGSPDSWLRFEIPSIIIIFFFLFFFLHSDNNTGQIKSASQTTVTLSFINSPSLIYIFFINHKELLIFTERPLSCICSFFFFFLM